MEITVEEGAATLGTEESQIWAALNCPDLEVEISIKKTRELRQLTRRKRELWPQGVPERSRQASRLLPYLSDAMHPEVIHSVFGAMMSARVERNRLIEAAREIIECDDEDRVTAITDMMILIQAIEERNDL